jgi:hypothetical protein
VLTPYLLFGRDSPECDGEVGNHERFEQGFFELGGVGKLRSEVKEARRHPKRNTQSTDNGETI